MLYKDYLDNADEYMPAFREFWSMFQMEYYGPIGIGRTIYFRIGRDTNLIYNRVWFDTAAHPTRSRFGQFKMRLIIDFTRFGLPSKPWETQTRIMKLPFGGSRYEEVDKFNLGINGEQQHHVFEAACTVADILNRDLAWKDAQGS